MVTWSTNWQVFVKQLKFVEDFHITDFKLLLCTIACCFSLFALGYDYVSPFPKSIYVLATCSVSYPLNYCSSVYILLFLTILYTYFIIMGYLTWYSSRVEGDCFLTTLNKDLAGIVSHIENCVTFNSGFYIEGWWYMETTLHTTSL